MALTITSAKFISSHPSYTISICFFLDSVIRKARNLSDKQVVLPHKLHRFDKPTVANACFIEPNSRFVAAKAATHGIYNTVKHRKANADTGEKIVCRATDNPASLVVLVNTERVETTLSFAVIPVTNAVDARQSSSLMGQKYGRSQFRC